MDVEVAKINVDEPKNVKITSNEEENNEKPTQEVDLNDVLYLIDMDSEALCLYPTANSWIDTGYA